MRTAELKRPQKFPWNASGRRNATGNLGEPMNGRKIHELAAEKRFPASGPVTRPRGGAVASQMPQQLQQAQVGGDTGEGDGDDQHEQGPEACVVELLCQSSKGGHSRWRTPRADSSRP